MYREVQWNIWGIELSIAGLQTSLIRSDYKVKAVIV